MQTKKIFLSGIGFSKLFNVFITTSGLFIVGCASTKKEVKRESGVAYIIRNHMEKKNSGVENLDSRVNEFKNRSVSNSDQELNDNNLDRNETTLNEENIIVSSKNNETTDSNETAANSAENDAILQIDLQKNTLVNQWIHYFSERDKERFIRMLERGSKYKEVVQNILQENGLPKELFYLALIESGFVTHARSHASAVGVWQFIKGTGKRYGLITNSSVDERRDPIRATEAAARYLRELYEVFQSWELSLAAYNCGEYRVLGAIMRGGTRDFWKLQQKGLLPKETQNYVPKFRAAALIGESPETYGISYNPAPIKYPELETVEVPSPISLKSLAQASGVELETLKTYNPHLLSGVTPSNYNRYEVWVPSAFAKTVALNSANIPRTRVARIAEADSFEKKNYYVVRSGDTLEKIARKFNHTISHLKSINRIGRQGNIFKGQKLRLVARSYHPNSGSEYSKSDRRVSRNEKQNARKLPHKTYKVRRGDTLETISRKFRISVKQIRKVNKFQGQRLLAGQQVKIPVL